MLICIIFVTCAGTIVTEVVSSGDESDGSALVSGIGLSSASEDMQALSINIQEKRRPKGEQTICLSRWAEIELRGFIGWVVIVVILRKYFPQATCECLLARPLDVERRAVSARPVSSGMVDSLGIERRRSGADWRPNAKTHV